MGELSRDSRMLGSGDARRMPAHDLRLSKMLEDCYRWELASMTGYTYRSIITQPHSRELSDVFDRIVIDEMEHFRLLGTLIVSLGGDPLIRMRLHTASVEIAREGGDAFSCAVTQMLSEAISEEKAEIDRYQTLLCRAEDRIVRSFLCQIIADEERHLSRLHSMR